MPGKGRVTIPPGGRDEFSWRIPSATPPLAITQREQRRDRQVAAGSWSLGARPGSVRRVPGSVSESVRRHSSWTRAGAEAWAEPRAGAEAGRRSELEGEPRLDLGLAPGLGLLGWWGPLPCRPDGNHGRGRGADARCGAESGPTFEGARVRGGTRPARDNSCATLSGRAWRPVPLC